MNGIVEFTYGGIFTFIRLSFAMLFYIGVFYLLFKSKRFSALCNETFVSGTITFMITAHVLLFVASTAALLFYSPDLIQATFTISTYTFSLFAALYLNQRELNEGKNLLVGTGVMACTAMGAYYCFYSPVEFAMQFLGIMEGASF
jgi:hypothetical protein